MPRYIDADALLERMESRLKQLRTEYGDHDHYTDGFDEGLVAVEDADTADVVEVVRCGNCKYFYKGRMGNRCTISLGLKVPHRDAWCCYGERKES